VPVAVPAGTLSLQKVCCATNAVVVGEVNRYPLTVAKVSVSAEDTDWSQVVALEVV